MTRALMVLLVLTVSVGINEHVGTCFMHKYQGKMGKEMLTPFGITGHGQRPHNPRLMSHEGYLSNFSFSFVVSQMQPGF